MDSYYICIAYKSALVYNQSERFHSVASAIQHAHAVIDDFWYDMDVSDIGSLTITNAETGETVWTERIRPIEE